MKFNDKINIFISVKLGLLLKKKNKLTNKFLAFTFP